MRSLIAAVCVVAVALLPACTKDKPPNSMFDSAGYHVRGDKVDYLAGFPGKANEVDDVDVASFEAVDRTYARDKSAVYYDGRQIPGADPATFELLDRKDGRTVHVNGNPIAGADPATFRVLAGAYAQDAGHVFYFADQIIDADAASFRVLNADFECTADEQRAYYRDTVIANADPGTFPPGKAVTGCDETSIAFAD